MASPKFSLGQKQLIAAIVGLIISAASLFVAYKSMHPREVTQTPSMITQDSKDSQTQNQSLIGKDNRILNSTGNYSPNVVGSGNNVSIGKDSNVPLGNSRFNSRDPYKFR
jgi:hypothetical protein